MDIYRSKYRGYKVIFLNGNTDDLFELIDCVITINLCFNYINTAQRRLHL